MAPVAVTEAARGAEGVSDRPWWTEADAAELDALTWELVDGAIRHREECAGWLESACPHVREAINIIVDWRKARELRSYARWVRHQRDLIELQEDRIVHRLRGAR